MRFYYLLTAGNGRELLHHHTCIVAPLRPVDPYWPTILAWMQTPTSKSLQPWKKVKELNVRKRFMDMAFCLSNVIHTTIVNSIAIWLSIWNHCKPFCYSICSIGHKSWRKEAALQISKARETLLLSCKTSQHDLLFCNTTTGVEPSSTVYCAH
jgi:hypothetical protein